MFVCQLNLDVFSISCRCSPGGVLNRFYWGFNVYLFLSSAVVSKVLVFLSIFMGRIGDKEEDLNLFPNRTVLDSLNILVLWPVCYLY